MGKKIKIILFLLCLTQTLFFLWSTNLADFAIYYHSNKLLLANSNPYPATLFAPLNYSPASTLIYSPLFLLNFSLALKSWLLISALILFALFIFLAFSIIDSFALSLKNEKN